MLTGVRSQQREDGWVDVVTVVVVWLYSIFVTIVIAIVYFLVSRQILDGFLNTRVANKIKMNRISWLNDLGRADRSHRDNQMENVIGHLSKLAVEHDIDAKTGNKRYILAQKANEAEVDE